jgi:plastocyanin
MTSLRGLQLSDEWKWKKDKNSRIYTKGISKIVTISVIVLIIAVASVTIFLLVSSGKSPSSGANISCSTSPSSSAVQISIYSGASNSANPPGYSPDQVYLVIGKNNTVTWTNNDSAHHTVTSSSSPSGASFNSGDMGQGATYSCTFTEAGIYHYYCKYHSWMTGTIVVENDTS